MLSDVEIILRLAVAAAFGGVVGFERERLLWAAGLRTHMLVTVGACLFMIVSGFGFTDVQSAEHVVLDPSRVAAQVVSGIGFLGAGTILLRGEVVKGLTTAASLWAVAAIGLAVGGGLYVAAIAATVIIVAILAGLKPIEDRYHGRFATPSLRLVVRPADVSIDTIEQVATSGAARVRRLVVQPGAEEGLHEVLIAFQRSPTQAVIGVSDKFRRTAGVVSAEIVSR